MTDLPTKPENEERTRKMGCWIACALKRQNLVSIFKYAIRILYVLGQSESPSVFLQKLWFYLKNKMEKYLNQNIVHR